MPAVDLCYKIAALSPPQRQNLFTHWLMDEPALSATVAKEEAMEDYANKVWQAPSWQQSDAAVPLAAAVLPPPPAVAPQAFLNACIEIAKYYINSIVAAEANLAFKKEALSRLLEEKIQTNDLHRVVRCEVEELHDFLFAPQALNVTTPVLLKEFKMAIKDKINQTLTYQLPYQRELHLMQELKLKVVSPDWENKGYGLFSQHIPAGIAFLRAQLENFSGELATATEVENFLVLQKKVTRLLSRKSSRFGGICREDDVSRFYKEYAAKQQALTEPEQDVGLPMMNGLKFAKSLAYTQ
jgi:hypothetical protein